VPVPVQHRRPHSGGRLTVYTDEPGTQDADRLALAIVLGTQALID
jgi:hypothetical protein